MRKVLQAILPLLTIVVIGASFFLLTKHHHDSEKVLGASRVAASTVQLPPVAKVMLKKRVITSPAPVKSLPTPIKSEQADKPTLTVTPIKSPPAGGPTSTPTPFPIKSEQADKPTTTLVLIKPTIIPTPTPTSIQSGPTSLPTTSGDSIQNYIMQKINDYRSSQGLGSVSTDSNTCSFARTRASEIVQSFNHDGFSSRISSHTLPYSSYHEVTENIAMTADYTQVVTLWINSSGHAENMRKDTPFVCVEKSGNYYAYEGWKP